MRSWIRLLLFSCLLLSVYVSIWSFAAEPTPTKLPTISPTVPTPTFSPSFVDESINQGFFLCPQIERSLAGPSWMDIAIGQSTLEDLETYLATIGDFTVRREAKDRAILYLLNAKWDEQQIPRSINICTQNSNIYVIETYVSNNDVYLENYVALYGEPDVVTWSVDGFFRLVFWFEEGIMVEAFAAEPDSLEWGRVVSVLYFPYQSAQGYEDSYPYNRTWNQFPRIYEQYEVTRERNPYNFPATIEAITAQPSWTPTLTPTPYSTPTAIANKESK